MVPTVLHLYHFLFLHVFIFSPVSSKQYSLATTSEDLENIRLQVNKYLNKIPLARHHDRCRWDSTRNARNAFIAGATSEFLLSNGGLHAALIQSLCYGDGSVGNTLGQYIENRICANMSKVHFVSAVRLPENEIEDNFLQGLPKIIVHPNPNPKYAEESMKDICICDDSCHEYKSGLLHKVSIMTRQNLFT